MDGIIFAQLKKFVDTLGSSAWANLLKQSGLQSRVYISTQEYPDQEAVLLVTNASKMTGKPAPVLLESFGEFIVPGLVSMYQSLIKPQWKTLDLIQHSEEAIHRMVRLKNPTAHPPTLKCSRPSPDEVIVEYNSPRKTCAVAKGISKGIAKHYNEKVIVSESSCMHNGKPSCLLSVKVIH